MTAKITFFIYTHTFLLLSQDRLLDGAVISWIVKKSIRGITAADTSNDLSYLIIVVIILSELFGIVTVLLSLRNKVRLFFAYIKIYGEKSIKISNFCVFGCLKMRLGCCGM